MFRRRLGAAHAAVNCPTCGTVLIACDEIVVTFTSNTAVCPCPSGLHAITVDLAGDSDLRLLAHGAELIV